jgi:hypothetical protein
MDLTVISVAGLSIAQVSTLAISSIKFNHSYACQKTVCIQSNQGVSLACTMKNCEPFVFGHLFAIDKAHLIFFKSPLNSSSKFHHKKESHHIQVQSGSHH